MVEGSVTTDDYKLMQQLQSESMEAYQLKFYAVFRSFAADPAFTTHIWQKRPFLCNVSLPNVENSYESSDLEFDVNSEFLEAGRGSFDEGSGWNMKSVSKPRGKTFEEAKLRYEDIEVALKERSGKNRCHQLYTNVAFLLTNLNEITHFSLLVT